MNQSSSKSNQSTPTFSQEAKSFLKSHQEEIQKQVEDNVVLYNVKDKNAFFIISPEEARIAIDIIKKRRSNGTHYCHTTKLKDQKWFKKTNKTGMYMFVQNISNLQVYNEGHDIDIDLGSRKVKGRKDDFYHEASVNLHEASVNFRGAVAQDDVDNEIFDIATNPRGEDRAENVRKGFLVILREKVMNDLVVYGKMLEAMKKKGFLKDTEEAQIEKEDVAIYLLQDTSISTHGREEIDARNVEIEKKVKEIIS